ncbi:MAG TPA: GAF domain-containing protein [Cellulomonas sp.]
MSRRDRARVAWPAGADPDELASRLRAAHEDFMVRDLAADPLGEVIQERHRAVRPEVMDSWMRSRSGGVDPERSLPPTDFSTTDLRAYRSEHVLAPLMPIVRRLLIDGTVSDGMIVALTDDSGHLLWVEGDHVVRREVERIGFVEGSRWAEQDTGTNAPGMALATGHEMQIFAAEHFTKAVHPWSCTAAPVHDPTTGRVLGVLDITGRAPAASPLMLSLVRATVAAMESALTVQDLRSHVTSRRPTTPRPQPGCRLEVLGTSTPVLTSAGAQQTVTLRHAELLLLLGGHPAGLTGEEIAVLLYDGTASSVTIRAEISRLRRCVGTMLTESRPYRLATRLRTDVDDVREHLARGDVLAALHAYPGPVLPRSEAPAVVALRDELAGEVHAAVIRTQDPRVLEEWTRRDDGSADWAAWRRLLALLPAGSPASIRARAHAEALDRELRAPQPIAHRAARTPGLLRAGGRLV